MVEPRPQPSGGGRPGRIGEPDAAWNELLDQKQHDLYIAYAKAIKYDLPLNSDGDIDWEFQAGGRPHPPSGSDYGNDGPVLPPQQAEIRGYANLDYELEPFRDICDEKWLKKLPDGLSLSRIDEAIQKIPEDGAAVFERIKGHISEDAGPAANNYRTYVDALNWSLDFQRNSLVVVAGLAALYRTVCEQMRKDVVEIVDQAIQQLDEIARDGEGKFSVDLLKFSIDTAFSAVSSGNPGAAAVTVGVNLAKFGIEQGIDAHQATIEAMGKAQDMMTGAKQALTKLSDEVEAQGENIRLALQDVRTQMEQATHKESAEHGSLDTLKVPAPSVLEPSNQQPDDWA